MMSEKCVRCSEEEPKVECSDCLSSKRKGEVASLCDACSDLIHVGFLKEHDVQPIALKLKKQEFKSQLEVFKKFEQKLKFKTTEMGYAKQDIDARVGVTQRAIHEALGKVFQAMKDKEQELLGIVKESVAQKKASLSDCETKLSDTMTKFNGILKETDGVLKAEPSEFMEVCEHVEKKITDASILKIESSFPSLGPLPTIDITPLLTSVERVQLSDVDEGVDISLPDEPKAIEEGEVLEVFMESRMDANGHFWVSRKMDAELNSILDNISYQIREDIVLNPVEKVEITEGMICCAQYQQDHRWYRAKVEQVKANQVGEACLYLRDRQWYRALVEQIKPGQNKAHVRWLDYAHENEVPVTHMYPLKEDFKTIPFQAMHCYLLDDLEGEMPRQARWEFADHTGSAPLDCTVLKVLSDKQLYHVELKNKQKPDVEIKDRIVARMDGSATKKDSIQCRDIRYMKDYTPPPASEIRAKQKQERERKGKRGGKDKRSSQQGQLSAEESDKKDDKKDDKKTADGDKKSDDKPATGGSGTSPSSSSGGDKSSSGGGGGGQTVTVTKKSSEGGNTEPSVKPSAGTEVNGKPADTVKDDSQAPTDDIPSKGDNQPKADDKSTSSIISTEAPPLSNKTPVGITVVGQDPTRGFVPISGQEKVPIPSVGGVVPNPSISIKEREAMVPSMQTFITAPGGTGVAVTSVVTSTPPRSSVVDDEDERDRQLTERLAQQGDHSMAHNPDSTSTLLPEVAQLFSTHSSLQQQGGVPLPGQIPGPMQGYANYPQGQGYNYNMGGQMQSQHGYYYMDAPGRMHMGSQGMPLQQPIHPGEMLPEHMHHAAPEMVTRSPPPPYSREVEQAAPDSTTGGWDENSWNESPARPSGPSRRMDDRTRYDEDSYRVDSTTVDMDDMGGRSPASSGHYSGGSSPMPSQDQRRHSDYRDNRHHHQQQQRQQGGRFACYRCGESGHQIRDCTLPPQPGEGRSSGGNRRRGGGGRGGGGGGGYRKSNRGQRR